MSLDVDPMASCLIKLAQGLTPPVILQGSHCSGRWDALWTHNRFPGPDHVAEKGEKKYWKVRDLERMARQSGAYGSGTREHCWAWAGLALRN